MFVRIRKKPASNYTALEAFFVLLRAYKDAERAEGENEVVLDQAEFWERTPKSQRHFFVWEKGKLTSAQAKTKLAEPRFDDERWNVTDLLHNLKTSDYLLDELVETGGGFAELRVKDVGDGFDGIDDLLELMESFALDIVGYQDGGSYIEVSSG